MDEVVERSLSERWLNTTLLAGFASVSLLLASVGVYGVVAFGVKPRDPASLAVASLALLARRRVPFSDTGHQ